MHETEPSLAEVCRQHLSFMKWADELMFAAVAEHAPDRVAVLQHIYLAERVWFRRLCGEQDLQLKNLEPPDLPALRNAWPELHREWLEWAAALTNWTEIVPMKNSQGFESRLPVWQIVLHVVNHGSYHRGQVSAMLRASGIAPPNTDLVTWYRSLKA